MSERNFSDYGYEAHTTSTEGLHGEVLVHKFFVDELGRPAGGEVSGLGLKVRFQDGPLQEGKRNGAFVEDLLMAGRKRLDDYQAGPFRCRENALAITKIEEALHWLDHRTRDRQARGVEGKHEV